MKGNRNVLGGLIALCLGVSVSYTSIVHPSDGVAYADASPSFQELESQRGLPVRGTSSQSVLSKFGEPVSRSGPVGDPPISMWSYDGFEVYFEHHLVITSVSVKDSLPTELSDIQ